VDAAETEEAEEAEEDEDVEEAEDVAEADEDVDVDEDGIGERVAAAGTRRGMERGSRSGMTARAKRTALE
jgi:hypothetical protein